MGSKHEGAIDQWQRGSVTPPEHNLRRTEGVLSRKEERLADPKAPHGKPTGRELRRAHQREDAEAEDAPDRAEDPKE